MWEDLQEGDERGVLLRGRRRGLQVHSVAALSHCRRKGAPGGGRRCSREEQL